MSLPTHRFYRETFNWLKFPQRDKKYITVDLGAWKGFFMMELEARLSDKDLIIAVEPNIVVYKMMMEKIIENNLNIIPVLVAVSNKTGKDKLYLPKRSLRYSLYKKNNFIDNLGRRTVLTTTWDDLMDMLDIKRVDFCKMNIEGAEEGVLEKMTKVFPKKMAIEEHTKDGITNMDNLKRLLKEKNYEIIKKVEVKDSIWLYVERT